MKNVIRFAIFFSMLLLLSSLCFAEEITVPLPQTNLQISTDGMGYARFSGTDIRFCSRPGEPQLPFVVADILLPPAADLDSVEVSIQDLQELTLEGPLMVKPQPPEIMITEESTNQAWPEGKKIIDGKDADIYEKDAFFPEGPLFEYTAGQLRVYKIVTVTICLARYNPRTETLMQLTDGDIKIEYSLDYSSSPELSVPDYIGAERVKDRALNYDEIAPAYMPASSIAAAPKLFHYAVITTNAIYSNSICQAAIDDFVDDKINNQGFSAAVYTETDWNTGSGTKGQNLRKWLQDHYLPADLNIQYVLIIGDPNPTGNEIPMLYNGWVPSDYYFAELTDPFDPKTQSTKDYDVIVGRIPYPGDEPDDPWLYPWDPNKDPWPYPPPAAGSGPPKLREILEKTTEYINADPATTQWRRKALIPIHPLNPANPDTDTTYQDGETLKKDILEPNFLPYHRIYERQYGFANPETVPCHYSTVDPVWCEPGTAREQFGIVYYETHGCYDHAAEIISREMAVDMDSDHRNIVYGTSCSIGHVLDPYNLGYFILKHGAVSIVASTVDLWVGDRYHSCKYYEKIVNNNASVGDAFYRTQEEYAEHELTLFGDPSVTLDLPAPEIMLDPVSFKHDFTAGSGTIQVNTSAGTSWTAVSHESWIHSISPSNGTGPGTVSFSFDANPAADERSGLITVNDQMFFVQQILFPEANEINAVLEDVNNGDIAWGDYNNDGRIDILLGGEIETGSGRAGFIGLYKNFGPDGSGGTSFAGVPTTVKLPELTEVSLDWGDFDNDGDLDILASGKKNSAAQTTIFVIQNNGPVGISGWKFDIVAEKYFYGTEQLQWNDLDNDGDLDICGLTFNRLFMYFNDGPDNNGTNWLFHQYEPGIETGSKNEEYEWCDFDKDGDLDLVIGGLDSEEVRCYENTGATIGSAINLVRQKIFSFSLKRQFVTCFDYDNDGDQDILADNTLIRNDGEDSFGNWIFSYIDTLIRTNPSAAAVGDFDNDGDLDLFCGNAIHKNNGQNGVNPNLWDFVAEHYQVPEIDVYKPQWIDYNDDGFLDLSLLGTKNLYGKKIRICKNSMMSFPNTRPAQPWGLTYSGSGNSVLLQWDPGFDVQTPSAGLTYNVYVGTSPLTADELSAHADISSGPDNGLRRIAEFGNSGSATCLLVRDLPPGMHYWGVQVIDSSFCGSVFETDSFFIPPGMPKQRVFEGVADLDSVYDKKVCVDIDGDCDMDISTCDFFDTQCISLKINSGTGVNGGSSFVPADSSFSYKNEYGNFEWADISNDGLPDLLVTGRMENPDSTKDYLKLYLNDGPGGSGTWNFTEVPNNIYDIHEGDINWVDIDHDGDLDLYTYGFDQSFVSARKIFRNDGGNASYWNFTEISIPAGENLRRGNSEWIDLDHDGDLDLINSGINWKGEYLIVCYSNEGPLGPDSWSFQPASICLPADYGVSKFVCGDYDNDGDVDMFLIGNHSSQEVTFFMRNDDSAVPGTFSFTFVDYGTDPFGTDCNMIDVNNDGWLDIVLGGDEMEDINGEKTGLTKVYINDLDVSGTFIDAGVLTSYIKTLWGDFDNDYDLDGVFGDAEFINNIFMQPNSKPNPPLSSTLSASVSASGVTFSWGPGQDNQTPDDGLNYNMYIGTGPGSFDIMNPQACLSDGSRYIIASGNVGNALSWTIRDLPSGTYYWGVQAIDTSFAGSDFASEQTFTVDPTISGTVTLGGSGLSGVEISADGISGSVFTDMDGNYEIMVPNGYTGRIRPQLGGYAFAPPYRDYTNVTADTNSQDYTASEARLRLEYKTEQKDNTWNIQAVLFIYNDGTTNLNMKDIKAEYWYVSEWPDSEEIRVDDARIQKYGTGGIYLGERYTTRNVEIVSPAQGGQDRKAVIGFTSGAGVLEPGACIEVKFRVYDKYWRNRYYFYNDYSYGRHDNLMAWPRIPVKYSESIVWGIEP
ncbi:MAG: VCBS repeat-containing protein [Spirochaetales bacterium]|nr:VCBS repeat-containing protein [Spirochaetales bacterium]